MKLKNILIWIVMSFMLTSCFDDAVARKPVNKASGSYIKKSATKNKSLLEKEIILIDSILKKSSIAYQNSTHGFRYFFNYQNPEAGLKPKVGYEAIYNYQVSSIDDKLIYSYEKIGNRSYKIEREDQLIGLRHAIQLLSVGDTATFYFPSHLMYGYLGDQEQIGINMPLKYQITLKELNTININN